jgi:hypothetical protein
MVPRVADPRARDTGAHDPVTLAERTAAALADTLTRMFGPYGYHALLTRALGQARAAIPALPALADVHVRATLTPQLDGVADAARTHGPEALTAGITVLLAAVVGLLGRVVGEQMALQLLERSMHSPDGPPNPTGRDAAAAAATTGPTEGGAT